jgi:hypothetical protein
MNYTTATLADVPELVRTIKALRLLARKSKVQTVRTQSTILRNLPAEVLCEVALQLDEPTTPVVPPAVRNA